MPRELDGQRWFTVGEVAKNVGVSPQTLRVWEMKGLLVPRRSPGGQRLYSDADAQTANQIALIRKRHGWNAAAILSNATFEPGRQRSGDVELGRRIREHRLAEGLTQAELAGRARLSRSYLSALERGEGTAPIETIARIAEGLGMPLRRLAAQDSESTVTHPRARPRTTLEGGVVWEELAPAATHLDPVMIIAPPGTRSGTPRARAGETFLQVIDGELIFHIEQERAPVLVRAGDCLLLPRGAAWEWHNASERTTARVLYVEEVRTPGRPRSRGDGASRQRKARPRRSRRKS